MKFSSVIMLFTTFITQTSTRTLRQGDKSSQIGSTVKKMHSCANNCFEEPCNTDEKRSVSIKIIREQLRQLRKQATVDIVEKMLYRDRVPYLVGKPDNCTMPILPTPLRLKMKVLKKRQKKAFYRHLTEYFTWIKALHKNEVDLKDSLSLHKSSLLDGTLRHHFMIPIRSLLCSVLKHLKAPKALTKIKMQTALYQTDQPVCFLQQVNYIFKNLTDFLNTMSKALASTGSNKSSRKSKRGQRMRKRRNKRNLKEKRRRKRCRSRRKDRGKKC